MEDSLQRIEIERLAWAGPVTPAPQFAPLGWVAPTLGAISSTAARSNQKISSGDAHSGLGRTCCK